VKVFNIKSKVLTQKQSNKAILPTIPPNKNDSTPKAKAFLNNKALF
jgi:hypothetical protein